MAGPIRAVRVERCYALARYAWEACVCVPHGEQRFVVTTLHLYQYRSGKRAPWPATWRSDPAPPPPDVAAELADLLSAEVRRAVMAACGGGQ